MGKRISIFGSGLLRQATAGMLACALLPAGMGLAQEQYPAPQGSSAPYQQLPPEQIDSLVAPIALYPDSLVAQIVAAATYPQQVVSAGQFLQQNGGLSPAEIAELANQQPWDPSVKGLTAFPQVVNDMNQNLQWTTQLGNAYYNQPQDVLSAVQAMRQRAYAAGNLRSTPQLNVEYEPSEIVIAPVSPAVVYVPYYNPWGVYGAPIVAYPAYRYYGPPRGVVFASGLALGFGVGLAIGAFSHFGWGFHNWGPSWGSRTIVYNHNTYISNSTTVINHGNYGGYDRGAQARAFNHAEYARYGGGNRTTINNVTINRGGNTFNNGGNMVNRGGQTYNAANTVNRGGQTYNPVNTVNRGGQTYNRGGQVFQPGQPGAANVNHGPQNYQGGTASVNRAQQGVGNGQYGRPDGRFGQNGTYTRPAAPTVPSANGQFSRPTYNAGNGNYGRPQTDGNRGNAGQWSRPTAPQQQQPQFSRPAYGSNGGGRPEANGAGGNGGQQQWSRPAAPAAPPQQHSAPGGEFHGGGGGGGHESGGGGGHEGHGGHR